MKKEKGITMVTLVVTIIVLIILAGVSINTLIGDNGIINKAKQARENISLASQKEQEELNQLYEEMEQNGSYIEDGEGNQESCDTLKQQIEELKQQNAELQEQLGNLNNILDQTNATKGKILEGYKAYSGGQLLTGTMMNRGNMSQTLSCGQSFTIPTGYHEGSGVITANSLASQTQATATANNLSSGATAWVNGKKITGNGTDVNNAYNNGYNVGYSKGQTSAVVKKPILVANKAVYQQISNTVQYTATANGYVVVDLSSWANFTCTYTVTKNGGGIHPTSSNGTPNRNIYSYTWIVPVSVGDTIVATVTVSREDSASGLYVNMYAIY